MREDPCQLRGLCRICAGERLHRLGVIEGEAHRHRQIGKIVFELDLDAQEFTTLGRKLRDLIDLNTDSVRCYRLDIAAVQRITIHGIGTVSTEPNHWLV